MVTNALRGSVGHFLKGETLIFFYKSLIVNIYSETYGGFIELIEVSQEEADELFPNRTVYYTDENGEIQHRSWHTKVGNKWHQFPESKDGRYWVKKTLP